MGAKRQVMRAGPRGHFADQCVSVPGRPLCPFKFNLSCARFAVAPPVFRGRRERSGVSVSYGIGGIKRIPKTRIIRYCIRALYTPIIQPSERLVQFQGVFLLPNRRRRMGFAIGQGRLTFCKRGVRLVSKSIRFHFVIKGDDESRTKDVLCTF